MSQFVAASLIVSLVALLITGVIRGSSDRMSFLDIGQGNAVLLQEGTAQVLIDGGPGDAVIQKLEEEMPTFDRTVELLIMSHPQQDHFEGFLHVIDQYNVGAVIMPNAAAGSGLQDSFLQLLEEKQIPYRFAWAGQHISVGSMQLSILAPFDTPMARTIAHADLNNVSTIVRVDFHGMSTLITGDAEKIAEHVLVQNTPAELLNVDLLMAGHHGSSSSTYNELLKAASPAGVPISVGKNNKYGHPTPQTLQRLAAGSIPIWRTDAQGTIRFLWGNNQWFSEQMPIR